MPRTRQLGLVALALLVPLAAVFELALGEWQHRRVPTLEHWSAAARAALAERHGAAGGVLVVPRWAGPLGRQALGAAADLHVAAPSDLDVHRRVVTFGLAGHSDPLIRGTSLRQVASRSFGPLEVRTYERPNADRLVRDLVDAFDERAAVERRRLSGDLESPCRFEPQGSLRIMNLFVGPATPRKRFMCAPFDPASSFVAPTVITDLKYLPRHCLFMPPRGSSVLRVELPKGPIGQKAVAYVGLHVFNERELTGAPVHARISIGGQPVAETTHVDGEGWKRFEGSTSAWAGREESVVLETWLGEGVGDHVVRPVCLAGELRD